MATQTAAGGDGGSVAVAELIDEMETVTAENTVAENAAAVSMAVESIVAESADTLSQPAVAKPTYADSGARKSSVRWSWSDSFESY